MKEKRGQFDSTAERQDNPAQQLFEAIRLLRSRLAIYESAATRKRGRISLASLEAVYKQLALDLIAIAASDAEEAEQLHRATNLLRECKDEIGRMKGQK